LTIITEYEHVASPAPLLAFKNMPLKLAINISYLFKERPFLERFEAAASAGEATSTLSKNHGMQYTVSFLGFNRFQSSGVGFLCARAAHCPGDCGGQRQGRCPGGGSLYTSRYVACVSMAL
jgi:hypothetical protein